MNYYQIHSFPIEDQQKIGLQESLRQQLTLTPLSKIPTMVAGVDLAYHQDQAIAVIIIMEHMSKKVIEVAHYTDTITEPYIPGMLAFRELPLILRAWEQVTVEPEVVFFDGNGLMHSRRMGIATHASLFLEKPTIGIAKTYLLGTYEELGEQQGDVQLIYDDGEMIGAALRTQTGVKPVYVSIGNYLTLDDAIRLSMAQVGKVSRVPEVVRQADIWTRKLRREKWGEEVNGWSNEKNK